MRRLAAFILIALIAPTLASAKEAGARVRPQPMHVVQRPDKAAPIRSDTPEPPLPILPAPPARADASRCTLACARTYYFCAAGENSEPCAPDWGQCRAACSPSALPPWQWRSAR